MSSYWIGGIGMWQDNSPLTCSHQETAAWSAPIRRTLVGYMVEWQVYGVVCFWGQSEGHIEWSDEGLGHWCGWDWSMEVSCQSWMEGYRREWTWDKSACGWTPWHLCGLAAPMQCLSCPSCNNLMHQYLASVLRCLCHSFALCGKVVLEGRDKWWSLVRWLHTNRVT